MDEKQKNSDNLSSEDKLQTKETSRTADSHHHSRSLLRAIIMVALIFVAHGSGWFGGIYYSRQGSQAAKESTKVSLQQQQDDKSNREDDTAEDSEPACNEELLQKDGEEIPSYKPPEGWISIEEHCGSYAIPKAWEDVNDFTPGISPAENSTIYTGYGTPSGFLYLGEGYWQYFRHYALDDYDPTLQPQKAPADAPGSYSTVLVGGGDGGCGGDHIAVGYKRSAWTINLPQQCYNGETNKTNGVTYDEVKKNLPAVIESIRVYGRQYTDS